MKQLVLILCLLVALPFAGCHHGKNTASILAEAEALVYEYPDSALQLMESISLPEQLTGKEQADYALLLSLAQYRCYIPTTSDSLISIAVHYYKETDNADKKGMAYYTLGGITYEIEKNNEKAILAYKEAESCIPCMKDSNWIPLIYSNLAYHNNNSSNYELAKAYYLKAKHINQLLVNHKLLVSNYLNLYSIYHILQKTDSVEWCTSQLLNLCPSLTDSTQLSKIHHNIGTWRMYQSQLTEAKKHLIQSLQYASGNPSYKTLSCLAQLYILEKQHEKADSLFQHALNSTELSVRSNIYYKLYKERINQGRYKEAITYADSYMVTADSFYNIRLNNKILEIQLKYDQLSLQYQNIRLERNFYLSLLVAIALLMITFRIIVFYRKKQQQLTSINNILQQKINELKEEMHQKERQCKETCQSHEQEMNTLQQKINQLEKLKSIYTSQGYLDLSEIKAAGKMKTIAKELVYEPKEDRQHLIHWLNTNRNGFAQQLSESYPQLTQDRHLDVCYLSAAGFDIRHIARLLKVKERTIEHYMTDICKIIQYTEEGKKGFYAMIVQLCMHPTLKNEDKNIAIFIKFK